MSLPLLPKQFKIANNVIKVVVEDIDTEDNNYGTFTDATNEIHLYKRIKVKDKEIHLSSEQIYNSFYHEVIHCFQFYFNNEFDEAQAQVFANFIREFQTTAEYEN